MSAARWLASPLAGTAGVCAGMCLLSIPLRQLTSGAKQPAVVAPLTATHSGEVSAVLRLRLLAPALRVRVTAGDGRVLLEARDLPAGESEHDVHLALAGEETDLAVEVEMADAETETAVFLTVMPDGREDRTLHVIGTGVLGETLHFAWPNPH